jgi:hypothetical protein
MHFEGAGGMEGLICIDLDISALFQIVEGYRDGLVRELGNVGFKWGHGRNCITLITTMLLRTCNKFSPRYIRRVEPATIRYLAELQDASGWRQSIQDPFFRARMYLPPCSDGGRGKAL